MPLSIKFCKGWHIAIVGLHLLAGIAVTYAGSIDQAPDLATGVVSATAIIVMGTLCFLIYPMALIGISALTRFAPVAALPLFAIYALISLFVHGKGSPTALEFAQCVIMSAWGLFNIVTANIANKDEHFNPICIFTD